MSFSSDETKTGQGFLRIKWAPTSVVGIHQSVADVIVGGVGVSIEILPVIQLLSDGMQLVYDLSDCAVCHTCDLLHFINILSNICSERINDHLLTNEVSWRASLQLYFINSVQLCIKQKCTVLEI